MYRALPLALLAATLAGCASDAPQLETERSYRVEWIGERPLIDRSHLTVTFAADGRAHGHAGCNHWFAGYRLKGDTLGFDAPGSTRKMCAPALMEQERRFLAALGEVKRWDFNDIGQLQLWPASGKPIRLWAE
ncbi:META domain-containing protein [Ectopseudomonas composti]|uniref:META domain-containing protein n=1 Tax=Ectopseudomonas composti TaxID=658457 RepID=UPI000774354D|nr:META domain-containing protein [Pseudomonas composti]